MLRTPDYKHENEILKDHSQKLAKSPELALKSLADHVLRICNAESVKISLGDWFEVAGKSSDFLNQKENVLIIPIHHDGDEIGTISVEVNTEKKKFDNEDTRILKSLAEFACTIHTFKGLEKTKKQITTVLSVSNVGFYDWDIQNNIIYFSEKMQQDWGIPSGTSLEAVVNFIHPEDREETRAKINEAIKQPSHFKTQYRVVRPDGKIIWIEAQGAVYFSEGKAVRFVGTSLDITDQKAEVNKLVLNARQNALIMRSLPVLVSYIDKDLVYQYVNETYEKWFNITSNEIVGKSVQEILKEKAFQLVKPMLDKAFKGRIVEFETDAPYPNGMRSVHATYTPDIDEQTGEVLGIVALVQDVSELSESLRQIDTERQKLSIMIKEAPLGVALMRGPNFIFENVNEEWRSHVSPREFIGKPHREVYYEVSDDTRMIDALKGVYESGISYSAKEMKFGLEVSPGVIEDCYFDFTYTRVLDGGGKPYGVFCYSQNVTDRVLANQKQKQYSETLASTVRELTSERALRDKFVATLTHDLRTPLTSARLGAQILIKKSDAESDAGKYSRRILAGLDRTERMVKNLLDARHIKAGEGIPVVLEECNLTQLTQSIIEDFVIFNGPRFELKADQEEIIGKWDGDAIRRVFENVIGNAVKYASPQTPITVCVHRKDKFAVISVHNKGNPIAEKDLALITDPFMRTQSAVDSGQKGWGIGLTLVKAIAEAHNGKFSVESSEDEGTTFFVSLPLL